MNAVPFVPRSTVDLSIVVPVYGCVASLEELCRRVDDAASSICSTWEIILVDDRSPDQAWRKIQDISARRPSIVGVRLSRNFGQHLAITAGMRTATGAVVVVMDCDLQDPPEKIPDLYQALSQGRHDIVFGRRTTRTHSAFRRLAARAYFKLLSAFTGQQIDASQGTYCIMARKVVDAFLMFNEPERHFLFILRWLGFDTGSVNYAHAARHSGKSSYNLTRLIKHAIDGMLFQTTALLSGIVRLGLLCTLASFAFGAYLIILNIYRSIPPGWTSLAVMMLFSTGVILASLGIVGLYIGKVFDSTKQRPLYVVDEVCGSQVRMSKQQ